MWKEIKEDPERLSEYNDRARHMKNEAAEKSDEVESSAVKNTKKPLKTPEFIDVDLDDSDTEDEEEKKESLGPIETELGEEPMAKKGHLKK